MRSWLSTRFIKVPAGRVVFLLPLVVWFVRSGWRIEWRGKWRWRVERPDPPKESR